MTAQGARLAFWLGLSRKGRKRKNPGAAASYLPAAVHMGLRVTGIMFAPRMVHVDPSFWDSSLQMRAWFRAGCSGLWARVLFYYKFWSDSSTPFKVHLSWTGLSPAFSRLGKSSCPNPEWSLSSTEGLQCGICLTSSKEPCSPAPFPSPPLPPSIHPSFFPSFFPSTTHPHVPGTTRCAQNSWLGGGRDLCPGMTRPETPSAPLT